MAKADKKSSRVAAEGSVVAYIHAGNRIGSMLELCCETANVAKLDEFKELANSLAMQVGLLQLAQIAVKLACTVCSSL